MKAICLSFVSLLSIAACATDDGNRTPTTSRANAQAALSAATAAMDRAADRADDSLSANVSITEPCGTTGTISLDGSYNGTDDGLTGKYDVTAKFIGCGSPEGTLDGTVRWQSEHDQSDFDASIVGNLDWHAQGIAASCAFDLHVSLKGGVASYTGTVCGYDVDELDLDLDDVDL
jgi:hypothetical protein